MSDAPATPTPGESSAIMTPPEETLAVTPQRLALIAHAYQVPISQGTLNQIADNPAPNTEKNFTDYVKEQAKGLYPTFAPQLDQGLTMAHLLDPYRQVAKGLLGDHFEPDFQNDPKSAAALSGGTVDPKLGRATPMTLDQWKSHIKGTPEFGWQYTPQAIERGKMISRAINEGFSSPPGEE